ncbi:Phosphotransferase enzyme family protein [Streptoalloteichus tenebrarius]|uniref:Phosphotransferase enzyme family protein n=1 Tax=Streptoalloteichus tenebrarius (strain ATCC 17920 / DSM 40477 / JCM 4838 / CBS 697.72 / NBRC 16177 / NCIMB 11028 / NRRL B-12390 / A12253. 1 / ISP 5477) TaxID=1933 RepID=A0ABT1HTN0_STRSD|nr:phosphotransferase [Streptoalloteichus tenebrarius]MCP2258881.1 Phosphotransferase enzyme family protein [Streptoalloteichus tenebrarius]
MAETESLLTGAIVDWLPPSVADTLARRLGLEAMGQVVPETFKERSRNAWFHGHHRGVRVFVKLYAHAPHGVVEQYVGRQLGARYTTEILLGESVPNLGWCNVFRWEPVTPLPHTLDSVETAATLLAMTHRQDPGRADVLSRRQVGERPYQELLARFGRVAWDVYQEWRDLLDGRDTASVVREAEQADAETPGALLHGDFSLRNVGSGERGRPVVFDFERSGLGPTELDLRRIWDRELAAVPGGRETFVSAYRAARGLTGVWPEPALLRYARLTCALTTITAARRTDDPQFEQEGRRILEDLRAEGTSA